MAEDHETRLQKFSSVLDGLLQDGRSHLKRIGLVRYDAVDGITGHQSFSLCLLDGEANGVLITHLTFKTNTRGYAVGITKGEPVRELGEEEMRAMNEALAKG